MASRKLHQWRAFNKGGRNVYRCELCRLLRKDLVLSGNEHVVTELLSWEGRLWWIAKPPLGRGTCPGGVAVRDVAFEDLFSQARYSTLSLLARMDAYCTCSSDAGCRGEPGCLQVDVQAALKMLAPDKYKTLEERLRRA